MGKKVKKTHNPKVKTEPQVKIQPQNNLKIQPVSEESPRQPQTLNKKIQKPKSTKNARIIIRNLVFDINEKHIRKLMQPYGEINDISIPKHPDKNTSRGFAFVELGKKNLCAKAIKDLNGSKYKGRTIVLDMAVSKETFMTEKLQQKNISQSQKQLKQEENQIDEEIKEEESEEQNDVDSDQEDMENEDEDEDEDEEQARIKADHECEIFVRNIPLSITEENLFKHFKKYGKIKFTKVVMNKETNTSKGTAFIKFYDSKIAQKLISYSRNYELFLQKKNYGFQPDPSINLEIDGMIVKVFPVQSKARLQEKVKSRMDQEEKNVKKKKPLKKIKKLQDLVKADLHDKRKLSLALLGKWKAEQTMNKNDYEKFRTHQKEKVQKLKNPNNSVSPTRIILKFLNKSITQNQIRDLCLKFLSQNGQKKKNLTYCKLMLDSSMKKSAGFAFVEFSNHDTSKSFIENLQENPQMLMNHPFVVEFAIQDSRKMLKLSKKSKKIKNK